MAARRVCRGTPCRSAAETSATNIAGTPQTTVAQSRSSSASVRTGWKRSTGTTRAPAASGAFSVAVNPNACTQGRRPSTQSSGVSCMASTTPCRLAPRLRCVSRAPRAHPSMAEV